MVSPEYRAFLQEVFAGLGAVDVRRLFDFDGLFCEGTIFGVVIDERVFLKTDQTSRRDFEDEGSMPFTYGADVATSYYELPARLFDDPDEAVRWARRAVEIALRSPTSLRKQKKGAKSKTARQPPRRRTRS